MNKIFTIGILLLLGLRMVCAEKSDMKLPVQINANHLVYDHKTETKTFSGNVVITRGSMVMRSDKAVFVQNSSGDQLATLTGEPGMLVTFRKKSDGGPDLWMTGQAERLEYDDDAGLIKLFGKARLTREKDGKVIDQSDGLFMSYDSRTEILNIANNISGVSTPNGGRVRIIMQPNKVDSQGKS